MTTPPDFRALCSQLLQGLDESRHEDVRYPGHLRAQMAEARAALSAPIPVFDTDGMAEQCLEMIRERLIKLKIIGDHTPPMMYGEAIANAVAKVAPIPVSERLPGAEDCDDLGRCWFFFLLSNDPTWTLEDRTAAICSGRSHWLPHWAIPLPEES